MNTSVAAIRKNADATLIKLAPLFDRLARRWSDEKEYEDIKDYEKVIADKLPKEIKIAKMTKRPFGFEFTVGNERGIVKVTARTIVIGFYERA